MWELELELVCLSSLASFSPICEEKKRSRPTDPPSERASEAISLFVTERQSTTNAGVARGFALLGAAAFEAASPSLAFAAFAAADEPLTGEGGRDG